VIASLRGKVLAVSGGSVVVDVGGVGFRVHVTAAATESARVGHSMELNTHMLVRENDITLYGFSTTEELELFRVLLGVTGIGPRTALATLSAFAPQALRAAIASGDAASLARTPGIGRKTAQRLLLDLRDRMGPFDAPTMSASHSPVDAEVVSALTALGYSAAEAQAAIDALPEDAGELDARILLALRYLAGR
jgi:holliday junction DNA helicase RuvA